MKTLYITDIDRTVRPASGVTERSRVLFRALAERGILTSAATGRSLQSALYALDGLEFSAPISVMTGAVIYDTNAKKELIRHTIGTEAFKKIMSFSEETAADLFVYTTTGNFSAGTHGIRVYHKRLKSAYAEAFRDMRAAVAGQEFVETEELAPAVLCSEKAEVIYAVAVGSSGIMEGASVGGVKCERYLEHATGCSYAEFFSERGGKDSSALEIKSLTGAERLVGFGDNYNDIALARVCDEFYAVEDAVEELLSAADGTVPSAEKDGVARYICRREGLDIG